MLFSHIISRPHFHIADGFVLTPVPWLLLLLRSKLHISVFMFPFGFALILSSETSMDSSSWVAFLFLPSVSVLLRLLRPSERSQINTEYSEIWVKYYHRTENVSDSLVLVSMVQLIYNRRLIIDSGRGLPGLKSSLFITGRNVC